MQFFQGMDAAGANVCDSCRNDKYFKSASVIRAGQGNVHQILYKPYNTYATFQLLKTEFEDAQLLLVALPHRSAISIFCGEDCLEVKKTFDENLDKVELVGLFVYDTSLHNSTSSFQLGRLHKILNYNF